MYPYLFGIKLLPMYGVLMAFGAIMAVLIALFRPRKDNIPKLDIFLCALFAIVFGIAGAKLFSIVGNFNRVISGELSILDLLKTGFIFYGGLILGVLGVIIYSVRFKIDVLKMFDALSVGLPFAHALGRIGCLCSGCCYGKPTDSAIGIVFIAPLDTVTPTNVALYPTQIIEAVVLFAIFAIVFGMSMRKWKKGVLTGTYVILYAIARFIIEFFRGDVGRVFNHTLTSSQIVSILLLVLVSALLIAYFVKRKRIARMLKHKDVYKRVTE